MPALDIGDLKKERESLEAQRLNALAVMNQAVGALALLDHLIERLDKPLDVVADADALKDRLGADEIEIIPAADVPDAGR